MSQETTATTPCGPRRFMDRGPKCAGASITNAGKTRSTRHCARKVLAIHLRISGAPQELSLAGASQELFPFHRNPAARKNHVGHPGDLDAFEHRVIDAHMVCPGADDVFALGVKDYEVGIAADSDRPFAWIQSKQLRRSSRNQFHKAIRAESSAGHAPRVNQAHAVLHARTTIGYFREIVAAHFFLLLEAKRAVIG